MQLSNPLYLKIYIVPRKVPGQLIGSLQQGVAVRELIEVSPLYKLNCWETWGNKPRVYKLLVKTILCGHGSSTYKTVERSLPKSKTSILVQVRLILGHLPTSRKIPRNKVHCSTPRNSQPSSTFPYVFIWLQETQGLAKEMGSSSFKEESVSLSGIPAYFMSQNCGSGSCR